MTVENQPSDAESGYQYDSSAAAPPEVAQLWIEVGNGLDKNQTGPFVRTYCGTPSHRVCVSLG